MVNEEVVAVRVVEQEFPCEPETVEAMIKPTCWLATSGTPKECPLCIGVPAVYLGSAFVQYFSFLPFRRISNLRRFNSSNSSIPTIPDAQVERGFVNL